MFNETYSSSLVPKDNVKKSKKEKSRAAPSSLFQRQHVDLLLEELIKKFPPQRVKVRIKRWMIKKALTAFQYLIFYYVDSSLQLQKQPALVSHEILFRSKHVKTLTWKVIHFRLQRTEGDHPKSWTILKQSSFTRDRTESASSETITGKWQFR